MMLFESIKFNEKSQNMCEKYRVKFKELYEELENDLYPTDSIYQDTLRVKLKEVHMFVNEIIKEKQLFREKYDRIKNK